MNTTPTNLPHQSDRLFLTDGGLETTLVFHDGMDLPLFASFVLMKTAAGRKRLFDYYCRYAQIAQQGGFGFVLESPTWRANRDWGDRLGYNEVQLAEANRDCIELMREVKQRFAHTGMPMVISGNFGPRGDGYQAAQTTVEAARAYHQEQMDTFAVLAVDMVSAMTINHVNEAIGITLAAKKAQLPIAMSFTLETDGRLPGGETLGEAIEAVDAATGHYPVYYMVNCAHPTHFEQALPTGDTLLRLRAVRANASKCSHAELDEAPELDAGNPQELGQDYARLRTLIPKLAVVGGCCGTDHRHIEHISHALQPQRAAAAAL